MITSFNNFTGITLETDITIITLKDNLVHSYCSKLSWEKDNTAPLGGAKVVIPYSESIEKYWSTYSDTVVIHANLNNKKQISNTKTRKKVTSKKKNNKVQIQNNEYNYSFIGKVSKFKQSGKNFILYLEDLGWKFLQKVPANFRKTYIAGQKLDDAFQAICEFMGIDFAYSLEGLSEYNFTADGYSIEKDGQVIEDTPSILEDFNKKNEEESPEKTEDENMANALQEGQAFEGSGLIDYEKNKTETKSNNVKNQALNQLTTNQRNNNSNVENPQKEENSKKKEEYEDEFAEKIKDLFKGNTLYDSNISDPILNYDWITVQPTSSASTTPTNGTSGATENTSNSSSNNSGSSSNNSNPSSGSNTSSSSHNVPLPSAAAVARHARPKALSKAYINTMSPQQAKKTLILHKNTGQYTKDTLQKLLWRSFGMILK